MPKVDVVVGKCRRWKAIRQCSQRIIRATVPITRWSVHFLVSYGYAGRRVLACIVEVRFEFAALMISARHTLHHAVPASTATMSRKNEAASCA